MVEIRSNYRFFSLIVAAAMAMTFMTTASAFAQNMGGGEDVPRKGGDPVRHECSYGSSAESVLVSNLTEDNVHFDSIIWTLCEGIMSADEAGDFRSNAPVSRAEAASATLRLYGQRTGTTTGHCGPYGGRAPQPFDDVEEGTPHSLDIVQAWCLGIWQGVTADLFEPDGSLTRAQSATAVIQTMDAIWMKNYGFTFGDHVTECIDPRFTDVELDSTHGMSINRLACAGIVKGVSAGVYLPQGTLTRGQLASVLYDTLDRRDWKGCCIEQ